MMTGYEVDVFYGEKRDNESVSYLFQNCLLRTPEITNDPEAFVDILWEKTTDAIQGKGHFFLVDETNFIYDFRLLEASPAFEKNIGWRGSYAH